MAWLASLVRVPFSTPSFLFASHAAATRCDALGVESPTNESGAPLVVGRPATRVADDSAQQLTSCSAADGQPANGVPASSSLEPRPKPRTLPALEARTQLPVVSGPSLKLGTAGSATPWQRTAAPRGA